MCYYAALLPRRGPHIASHSVCLSVCPSVCLSVRPVRPVLERHLAPPSELQWHTEGCITYGHLGRTNLLITVCRTLFPMLRSQFWWSPTYCSAERSFSKLELIENRLRTSMTQGRLVNLAIMSIEWDILREIDFKLLPLSVTWLLQNRERCLVFDFRVDFWVCVGLFELQVHAWFLYWCFTLILNNAFSYFLVLYF